MAERGEGTAAPGGSHSRATTSPLLSTSTRGRHSTGGYHQVGGGLEGNGTPLPLRKRKFAIADLLPAKRHSIEEQGLDCQVQSSSGGSNIPLNLSTSANTSLLNASNPSSGKRLRPSCSSTSDLKETFGIALDLTQENSSLPAPKRPRRESHLDSLDPYKSSFPPSLATQASATPTKLPGVVSPLPSQRRSSRGSYPKGFYAEEEQRSLAAFRDRTSELKSKGEAPEFLVSAGEVEPRKRRDFKSNCRHQEIKGVSFHSNQSVCSNKRETGNKSANKNRVRKKKMTEKTTSWNSEGKQENRSKDLIESDRLCVFPESTKGSSKATRRHTLPGRKETTAEMGVTLSKCLASRTQSNTLDATDAEPRPSTSGLSNLDSTPKMFDQLLRRLPLKKKSNSEQDLSQFDPCVPSSSGESSKTDKESNGPSAGLRKHQDVKRRKSANLETRHGRESPPNREKKEVEQSADGRTNTERSPSGGIFKLYPLRNRLRLSDGGGSLSSAIAAGNGSSSSSNLGSSIFGCQTPPPPPPPPPPQLSSSDHSHNYSPLSHPSSIPQSQSLPSSPSSTGVAFLDTFRRRLRDSRRLSHEHSSQIGSSSNSRRAPTQVKDTKQSSVPWKRGHAIRKSPLSSKRNGRGKSSNSGTCQSNSQHTARCVKGGIGTIPVSGMSGSHGSHPFSSTTSSSRTQNQAAFTAQNLLQMSAGSPTVPPLSVPPSSLAGVLTSTSSNASGLLPPSLAGLGAIGSSGNSVNGGATSGSSSSTAHSTLSVGGALGGLMGTPADSESEENEMGRLEALLTSRGLPPSLFGALGPRMQHILHRSVSSSISSKAQQLLVGLQATGDESEQLQAVIEMCQLLVMGNEDTLAGFPIKQVTPALINLLNMEHNFDMMNNACRALTYMMEALPRSSAIVVEAVPVFLGKLKVIQCMDVAEQSLTALNMLSRKHSKAILQADGVSSCLTYIDFFSTNAQRAALSITANCFQNLTADEFHFASGTLRSLSSRLTTQGDKKCVESVCLAYSRLVDCFQNDPNRLQEIAGHDLLTNIQQLLVMSPPVLSSVTFIMVMRMLSVMCSNCPELAVTLLKNNIAQTLCYLLTSSTDPPLDQVELVPRSPQELYEITCLIGELMPVLPSDGIFVIDGAIQRPNASAQEMHVWQWQDDRGTWHNYSPADSRVIELAHQLGEDEISVCVNGRAYTLDFHSMHQINDNTSTIRSVQRRMVPVGSNANASIQNLAVDARAKCLKENEELASTLIKSLFSLLYEVYSSSAGPAVRYKCLRALLRMVHFSSPDLLQQVLKSQAVSSHLATMLSSFDLKIIVGALQMAELLMQKLPQIFAIYFRREGVMHQIKRLCDPDTFIATTPATTSSRTSTPSMSDSSLSGSVLSSGSSPNLLSLGGSPLLPSSSGGGRPLNGNGPESSSLSPSTSVVAEDEKNSSPSQRLSDVLKRKRPKAAPRMSASGFCQRGGRQEEAVSSSPNFSNILMKNAGFTSGRDACRGMGSRAKLLPGSGNSSSSSASGRTASFISSFNPIRWGRCNNATPTHENQVKEKAPSGNIGSLNSSNLVTSSPNTTNSNREYIRNWIREQAQRLNEHYFTTELQGSTHPALTVLNRLIAAINQLEQDNEAALRALFEISQIVKESDISPFEVIHSGLVLAMLNYLTATDGSAAPLSTSCLPLPSSILAPSPPSNGGGNLNVLAAVAGLGSLDPPQPNLNLSSSVKIPREKRLRNFLHVFLGCSLDALSVENRSVNNASFSALVSKLNGCVNQLEQFPVKVHDLPVSALAGSGRGGSTSAIKFFNTHQLKCNLQRHPECTRLRQWRGGPVKVDPLALVQAIERYLVIRGYGRIRDDDDDNSDDDNSDEDIDDTLAAVSVNQSSSSHKLQFLIGDHVLPYNMTVFQAIRQYSSPDASTSEADTDSEMPISHSSIWLQTHTIHYRPVLEETNKPPSGRKGKCGSKQSPKKKGDVLFSESTIIGGSTCALENQLSPILPGSVTVRDPSLEVLSLLRVLFTLNRNYGSLYPPAPSPPALPNMDFANLKLTAKANRQLQDPLVIMTGNLPQWLPQIAYACPFLFPFETRQLLFYAVSFDRDRALQRLMDSAPELNSSDSSERVTPRLERRKRTVSREDILKQAENVINDLASSRAMLEIQYENEVGTGLGPTLEFYALVSKELQKADLELWRGETVTVEEGADLSVKAVKYVSASHGLYPLPVARNMKSAHVAKLKTKFRFLGKFMAKAVMDSRMLDVGLHECAYKWFLSEERSLGMSDVISLDPVLGQTLTKLQNVVLEKKRLQERASNEGLTGCEMQEKIDALTVDGCKIEDLSLNFTLPGYSHIDLRKGGSDMEVNINNLEQYLHLVVEWLVREGAWRQMDAMREGFESVFPLAQLKIFYPEELEQLFCGNVDSAQWDIKQLAECCRPDHGYTHNSKAVRFLLEILSEYCPEEQRSFLQFVTGSPRLPVGGFKSLTPPLTIVRKTFEAGENPDNFLPSVMTCVNYLKLPDYTTKEIMKEKLSVAAKEGQHSFHLS